MTVMTETVIKDLVSRAANEAAQTAIRDVFTLLRVDRADVDSMTSLGDDLRYLRRQREAAEKISVKVIMGFFGAVLTGAGAVLIMGLQDFFHWK